jgi:outer membrane protein OmpA-like peptidoglycan-associated protein
VFRYNWDRDYIPKFAIQGFAYNEDDSTKTSFKDYDIKLYQIDRDSSEILINEAHIVDEKLFFFPLKQNKNYKLVALKDGYFPNDATASTMGLKRSDTLFREIPLKKLELNQSIVLKDIYYDFDKSSLRPESNKTLASLVEILNVNPGIIVEFGAHTDSKGDDLYNEKLSQRRAESVVKYLKKEGINKERMVAKGYGESQFIAPNSHPDGSDNPEGRQLNRRTEIKVIGKTDIEVRKKDVSIDDALKDAEGE